MGTVREPPEMLEPNPLEISEEFECQRLIEAIIIAALKEESISTIGICGIDGIGRTRLATEIGEKAKREKLFNAVVMKSFLATPNELLSELIMKDKILIILDDVPKILDIEKIGILLQKPKRSCKIMITSRFMGVFMAMGAHKIFTAKGLGKEELWIPFRDKVGNTVDSSDLYHLARSVAKEFRGFSFASSVVDRILKEKSKLWPGTLAEKILNPALSHESEPQQETVAQGLVHFRTELSNQASGGNTCANSQYDMNEKSFCSTSRKSTATKENTKENERQKEEISHEAKLEVSIDMVLCDKKCVTDCILFCSVFPSDYIFTKDMLVWQWIAEGLIKLEEDEIMEEAYIQCFDALLNFDYIVAVGYNFVFDQVKYKFGDKMIAFLQKQPLEPKFQKYLDNEQTDVAKVEHLSLAFKEIDHINFGVLKECGHLRTLIIHRCYGSEVKRLPSDFFLELKALKILNLSHTNIDVLPSSVEHLTELRYLDISETPTMSLPEFIGHFSHLQTLILDRCLSISELPDSTSKLINLRHLVINVCQLQSMPVGIGKLSKLRTLTAFLVGQEDGRRIGELKELNKLKGSLQILNLENVMTGEEAAEACLCNKQDLKKIELYWDDLWDEKNPDEEEILESLQPPLSIHELKIIFYSGGVLPSWISNPLFSELVSISLYWCRYCDSLPSLGELPSLKILNIVRNSEMIEINSFFCRKQSNQHHVAFPKLEELSFYSMSKLEKWTGLENGDFPRLRHLMVEYCPKFVLLPFLSHLNSLSHMEICYCPELSCLPEGGLPPTLELLLIRECPGLKVRCCDQLCEDWSKVAHVPDFYIDGRKISL